MDERWWPGIRGQIERDHEARLVREAAGKSDPRWSRWIPDAAPLPTGVRFLSGIVFFMLGAVLGTIVGVSDAVLGGVALVTAVLGIDLVGLWYRFGAKSLGRPQTAIADRDQRT